VVLSNQTQKTSAGYACRGFLTIRNDSLRFRSARLSVSFFWGGVFKLIVIGYLALKELVKWVGTPGLYYEEMKNGELAEP